MAFSIFEANHKELRVTMPRKLFISYHHANDQWAKEELLSLNQLYGVFHDMSVNSGDIDDTYLDDQQIRQRVRDYYLRDSTVTMVLVGTDTRYRKHVDWELYSSMRNTELNAKSGVVLVTLPSTGITHFFAGHGAEEKQALYPEISSWTTWNRGENEKYFPSFSTRMIDNLICPTANISVVPWQKLENNPDNLRLVIELAHSSRADNEYDFSMPMRRRNGPGPRR